MRSSATSETATPQPQGHQLGLPVVNVGEAAIKFRNLALDLSPLAFLTMHSAIHFGLEDIRVSEEIGNLGPHPALKFGSGEVLGTPIFPRLPGHS